MVLERSVAATSPNMSAMAIPWNMGSKRITEEPTTTAAAVSSMGLKRMIPACITASFKDAPSV